MTSLEICSCLACMPELTFPFSHFPITYYSSIDSCHYILFNKNYLLCSKLSFLSAVLSLDAVDCLCSFDLCMSVNTDYKPMGMQSTTTGTGGQRLGLG